MLHWFLLLGWILVIKKPPWHSWHDWRVVHEIVSQSFFFSSFQKHDFLNKNKCFINVQEFENNFANKLKKWNWKKRKEKGRRYASAGRLFSKIRHLHNRLIWRIHQPGSFLTIATKVMLRNRLHISLVAETFAKNVLDYCSINFFETCVSLRTDFCNTD